MTVLLLGRYEGGAVALPAWLQPGCGSGPLCTVVNPGGVTVLNSNPLKPPGPGRGAAALSPFQRPRLCRTPWLTRVELARAVSVGVL